MKLFLSAIVLVILVKSQTALSQTGDTTVVVGNHTLHFEIMKGSETPILFEAGAGDNVSVWSTILQPIAEITGATLITYDRAGFGESTIDTSETDASKHGIIRVLKT